MLHEALALDPQGWSLWVVAAAFALFALLVWLAGTRLAKAADAIARRTGMGQALAGMVLLGVATSLPELSTTATASLHGRPALAVNNLLGGIAFQMVVLALADARLKGDALASVASQPGLLLEATLLAAVLAVAAGLVLLGGGPLIGWVGAGALVLFLLYLGSLVLVHRYRVRWRPVGGGEPPERERDREEAATSRLVARFAAAAAVVLVAGAGATLTAEAIADRTPLGEGMTGALLLAVATSLPEVSTTWAAIGMGAPALAVGNILGTNLADAGLVLAADLFYVGGSVLAQGGAFAAGMALLGVLLTCILLVGLLERRERTVFGVGIDTLASLAVYAGGLWLLRGLA